MSAKAAMATMATMERLTGLKCSENRGREFLKAMGLKLRKLGLNKECLYSTYYATFSDFKQTISDCLAQTPTTHKQELDLLLTLRFQTFKKSPIMEV